MISGLLALQRAGLVRASDAEPQDGPWLGPCLSAYFSPSMHKGFAPPEVVPDPWAEASIEALGPAEPGYWACPLPQFEQTRQWQSRSGFRGITAKGRRAVREAAAVMESSAMLCSFWTIELSDEAVAALAAQDAWSQFVAGIRQELVRCQERAGIAPHVIGVAEIHPVRSRRMGFPVPHLHILYRSRRDRRRPWLLSTTEHDELLRRVLARCGAPGADVRASSNVGRIRKSVGGYLAKYLSKGSSLDLSDRDSRLWLSILDFVQVWLQFCVAARLPLLCRYGFQPFAAALRMVASLVPRQWWLQSRELRRVVMETSVQLPHEFCAFVVECRSGELLPGGLEILSIELDDPRAPPIWRLRWDSVAALAAALALWTEECHSREEISEYARTHGCLHGW